MLQEFQSDYIKIMYHSSRIQHKPKHIDMYVKKTNKDKIMLDTIF